jgi:regulatory protein
MTLTRVSVYNIPMEKPSSRPHPEASARNTMMDILARRNHTEKEMRDKLSGKFTSEEIDLAIEFGKIKGWFAASAADLQSRSEEMAAHLKSKGKGQVYINQYLEEKGLNPVKMDPEQELEKALELVENKFSDMENMDAKEKAKVGRFLVSRGFDIEIIRKVIKDETL